MYFFFFSRNDDGQGRRENFNKTPRIGSLVSWKLAFVAGDRVSECQRLNLTFSSLVSIFFHFTKSTFAVLHQLWKKENPKILLRRYNIKVQFRHLFRGILFRPRRAFLADAAISPAPPECITMNENERLIKDQPGNYESFANQMFVDSSSKQLKKFRLVTAAFQLLLSTSYLAKLTLYAAGQFWDNAKG